MTLLHYKAVCDIATLQGSLLHCYIMWQFVTLLHYGAVCDIATLQGSLCHSYITGKFVS